MPKFAYFCGHEQWHPEELVEQAVHAEAAGFDAVVVSEHFHPWVDDVSASGFAFSTIGAMAQATERVQADHWSDHPPVQVSPRSGGPGRRHPGPPFRRPLHPRGRDRREHQRGTAWIRVPRLTPNAMPGWPKPWRSCAGCWMAKNSPTKAPITRPIGPSSTPHRIGPVPILLAAGGPKSAALAGAVGPGCHHIGEGPRRNRGESHRPARGRPPRPRGDRIRSSSPPDGRSSPGTKRRHGRRSSRGEACGHRAGWRRWTRRS